METKIESPKLASQAPKVIKIKAISPLKEMLLEKQKSIMKRFIVAASNLSNTLKMCLYWNDKAIKAIKNPNMLTKAKGYVLIS